MSDETSMQCLICHKPITLTHGPNQTVVNERDYVGCPNGHFAHRDCIKNWFIKQSTCPICYAKYDPLIIDSFQDYFKQVEEEKRIKAEADRARKELEKKGPATPLDPEFARTMDQAQDLLLEENFKEALKVYWAYLDAHPKLPPSDPRVLQCNAASGVAYYKLNKYDLCIQQFSKVVKVDPQYPHAFQYLEVCYEKVGMLDKAKWAHDRIEMARTPTPEAATEQEATITLENQAKITTIKKSKDGNALDDTVVKDFNKTNVFFAKKTSSSIRMPTPAASEEETSSAGTDKFSAKMAEIKNKSKDLEKKLAAKKVKEDIAEVSTKKAAKPTKASAKAVAKANEDFDVDSFLEETPAVLNMTAKTAASKNAPPSKPPVSPPSKPPVAPPTTAPPMAPSKPASKPAAGKPGKYDFIEPPLASLSPSKPAAQSSSSSKSSPLPPAPPTAAPPKQPSSPPPKSTPPPKAPEPSMDLDFSALDSQPELENIEQDSTPIDSFSTDIPQNNMFFGNIPPLPKSEPVEQPFIEPEPEPELEPEPMLPQIPESPSEISTPAVDEDYMAQLQREMDQKFGSENPEEVSASPPVIEEAETPPARTPPSRELVKKCLALQISPNMEVPEIDQKAGEIMYQLGNLENLLNELSEAYSSGKIDDEQYNQQDSQMKTYMQELNDNMEVLKELRETWTGPA